MKSSLFTKFFLILLLILPAQVKSQFCVSGKTFFLYAFALYGFYRCMQVVYAIVKKPGVNPQKAKENEVLQYIKGDEKFNFFGDLPKDLDYLLQLLSQDNIDYSKIMSRIYLGAPRSGKQTAIKEFARRLKSNDRTKGIPVCFFSMNSNKTEAERFVCIGRAIKEFRNTILQDEGTKHIGFFVIKKFAEFFSTVNLENQLLVANTIHLKEPRIVFIGLEHALLDVSVPLVKQFHCVSLEPSIESLCKSAQQLGLDTIKSLMETIQFDGLYFAYLDKSTYLQLQNEAKVFKTKDSAGIQVNSQSNLFMDKNVSPNKKDLLITKLAEQRSRRLMVEDLIYIKSILEEKSLLMTGSQEHDLNTLFHQTFKVFKTEPPVLTLRLIDKKTDLYTNLL